MSEFEDDLDDQLLELAGASERKKRSKSKTSRKRKSAMDSDSERELESEADSEDDEGGDPYPYEGKYKDEADKQELLSMNEMRREEILAERLDEKARLAEKQVLARMVAQQRSGIDEDSAARSAKRQTIARGGGNKEKSRKLDELKAKRKAKDESRKRVKLSPRRSSSPQDMDISDEESEDGQFTRSDHEEERERRLLGASTKQHKEDEEDKTPASLEDFNTNCRLTRDLAAKWCLAPWFKDYVKGTWVRYLIGNESDSSPVYRMCEVQSLSETPVKPYKINDRMIDLALDLKHGKAQKAFNMDRISNSQFTKREYDRLVYTCKTDDVKFPTRQQLKDREAEMRRIQKQPLSDGDITEMLRRKKELQVTKSSSELMLEKSKLNQTRSLALKRLDHKEAAELEQKIAELEVQIQAVSSTHSPRNAVDDREEALRRVNERNRKANLDAVRKAEIAESERRRKERELAAAASRGGAAAAAAVHTKFDPSARLKTMPRMFNAATPTTRPGTPAANGSKSGAPAPGAANANAPGTPDPSIRAIPTANTTMAFEKKLLDSIELDLGDF